MAQQLVTPTKIADDNDEQYSTPQSAGSPPSMPVLGNPGKRPHQEIVKELATGRSDTRAAKALEWARIHTQEVEARSDARVNDAVARGAYARLTRVGGSPLTRSAARASAGMEPASPPPKKTDNQQHQDVEKRLSSPKGKRAYQYIAATSESVSPPKHVKRPATEAALLLLKGPFPLTELSPNVLCGLSNAGATEIIEGIVSRLERLVDITSLNKSAKFLLLKELPAFLRQWQVVREMANGVQEDLATYTLGSPVAWVLASDKHRVEKMLSYLDRFGTSLERLTFDQSDSKV